MQDTGYSFRKASSPKLLREAAALMAAGDPWRRLGLGPAACAGALRGPGLSTYFLYSGGRPAGHVAVSMLGPLRGYIKVFFVREEFRGLGAGAELMRRAEELVFASSPNVFLCVSSFNRGARRFYARMGYRRAGLLKGFLVRGADEILLRKTLGPALTYRPAAKRKK